MQTALQDTVLLGLTTTASSFRRDGRPGFSGRRCPTTWVETDSRPAASRTRSRLREVLVAAALTQFNLWPDRRPARLGSDPFSPWRNASTVSGWGRSHDLIGFRCAAGSTKSASVYPDVFGARVWTERPMTSTSYGLATRDDSAALCGDGRLPCIMRPGASRNGFRPGAAPNVFDKARFRPAGAAAIAQRKTRCALTDAGSEVRSSIMSRPAMRSKKTRHCCCLKR